MKRFLILAAAVALSAVSTLTASAADCGCGNCPTSGQSQQRQPVRNVIRHVVGRGGPVAQTFEHAAESKPLRTVVGRVIDLPSRIVDAGPLVGGCPNGRCVGR